MVEISLWTLFLLPFAAAAIILLGTLKKPMLSANIACTAISLSFLLSLFLLAKQSMAHFPPIDSSLIWMQVGSFQVEFGVLSDKLSALMCVVVTGVATGVFFYSREYMHGDKGFARYYASLSLFCFSMLGIVLANHLVQTFIFWELVGLSSYLLIGHWFEKDSAAEASKKAFLTTRVGDVGFFIGILLLWTILREQGLASLNFIKMETLLAHGAHLPTAMLTAACIGLFLGAVGKSAQFPLHVWLPDAMEGPTPVSALIHAATMVAAGIYMLARLYFLFSLSPAAMEFIAWTGGFTCLFAATIAMVQNDIKRILAYSTLSQLGYMIMAVGLYGSGVAMYHLITHAFFKALLFLGAGSVIHGLHTQNIWEMGGVFKKMPVTSTTFLIGFLALAGVFPLSGFWSKDEIILLAYQQNHALYVIAAITAFLTACYMGRLFFTVFLGPATYKKDPHESGRNMTIPMIILAVLSIFSGFFGLVHLLHHHNDVKLIFSLRNALTCSAISLSGIGIAYVLYGLKPSLRTKPVALLKPLVTLLEKKFFVDEFYDFLVSKVQQSFANLCQWFEQTVIIELGVNGVARITRQGGKIIRRCNSGNAQDYALAMITGLVFMIFWILFR